MSAVAADQVREGRQDDPVVTEIVRNSVVAITEEMKSNLMRTACSMIIYEAQDFTVGLFDANGDTVSIGIGLPMFVHGMSYTVKAMLAHFTPEGLVPGDVLVTNDAYITGSHLNHVTLAVPIFDEGVLVGFSACMAHWADIGAALNIVTRDIYSEGLQLPILKIYKAGVLNQDLVEIMRMNVRIPERGMGDLNAQIAAVKTGALRFTQLIARYGRDAVLNGIAAIMDRSEALARQQVASIPDGVYEAESYMDDDGVDAGQRVPIRVKVIVEGEQMTVDLSGMSLQVKGFYNSGESAGISCCQVAFKCVTSPLEKPINHGNFRALKVILPKGTVVSAVKPAPMMKWMTFPMTVADTIFKALAKAVPERVIAGHHADLMSVHINGKMPNDGRLFIVNGGLIGGGWGATSEGDGSHVTICINDGDTHNSPLEQLEAKYPMLVERYALREDSGGAGRHQGGLGAEFVCRSASEFMFNAGVERVHCRPWGLFDGHPGAGNEVSVRVGDEPELRFPSGKVYGRQMQAGDAYILRSGGGGGYGSPLDRPPEQIAHDLREGYISRARAESCYGVCFDAEGGIDVQATRARRAELHSDGEFSDRLAALQAEGVRDGDPVAEGRLLTAGRLFPLRCC